MKRTRLILDTNIWISFLITKSLKFIDKLINQDHIVLLFSEELLTEFIQVSSRDKLKKFFSENDIHELLELIDEYGQIITVTSKIDICRDKADNFLLELAVDGKADYLVTGDLDLLEINNIDTTQIISLKDFINNFK